MVMMGEAVLANSSPQRDMIESSSHNTSKSHRPAPLPPTKIKSQQREKRVNQTKDVKVRKGSKIHR